MRDSESRQSLGSAVSGRRSSKSKASVCVEEHKSRVTNTSKHIYKPKFAMPAKETTPAHPERKKAASTYHLPDGQKKPPVSRSVN
jgi:hypothetical protein